MPEKWTGHLLGKMHNERITYDDLAAEIGITKGYICMILNSRRNPPGCRERLTEGVERIIQRRATQEDVSAT